MSRKRILIVDANAELRKTLAEYVLGPEGHSCLEAASGQEALQLASRRSIDLVLADQHLPDIAGIDVLRELRLAGLHMPVVIMTVEGSESLAVEALREGASGYVRKPFRTEDIMSAVRRALARAEIESESYRALQQTNRQLKQRLQQLEALQSIGRALTSALDMQSVLSRVIEAAVGLTGAEEGSILLHDDKTGELTMVASKNFDEAFVHTFRIRTEDSIAGEVIRTGQPYLLGAAAPQKIKTAYLVHSLVYVPLKLQDRVIGVLGVDNRQQGTAFTEEVFMPLGALADFAAVAIQNALLYEETHNERTKLETTLEHTADAVIILDEHYRIILINSSARQLLGVREAEPIGTDLRQAVRNADVHTLLYNLDGRPESRRVEVELPDDVVMNAHLTPVPGVGYALIMQDITYLKQLDRIKSEFVNAVSHDLRSPLTTILGYTELIARTGPVNDKQTEYIRRVRISVNAITTLVNDLLDLGRIEAGVDTQKEVIHFPQLVRYAMEGQRGRAADKHIMLEAEMADNVQTIFGNPIRLKQLATNLIENAVKYTPEGGQVHVRVSQEGDLIRFTVTDNGIGISPQDQNRIFEKFFRSESVLEMSTGSGLGLAIVKSIVDNHAGRIWVDSRLGEGSTFTVLLPIERTLH